MTNKFKLVYIISDLGIGGAQVLLFDIINDLKTYDYFDISVITLNSGEYIEKYEEFGIRVFDLKEKKLLSISVYFKLKKLLMKLNPDIVHTHCAKADLYGRIAAKRLNTKLIFSTCHNYSTHHKWADIGRKSLYDYVDDLVIMYSKSYLISVSDIVKKYLINRNAKFGNITEIIYNGVNTNKENKILSDAEKSELRERFNIGGKDLVISVMGRLELQKGHKFFLDSIKDYLKDKKNLKVLIIGDGSMSKEIEELIVFNGISEFVRVLGFQTNIDKFIEISDIVAVPSLWEAFGLVIIEAMIKKKIVLASNTGGIPEVIKDGENGFLFESENKNSLLEKLNYICQNIDDLSKVRENADSLVKEKFDIKRNSEFYCKSYIDKINKI